MKKIEEMLKNAVVNTIKEYVTTYGNINVEDYFCIFGDYTSEYITYQEDESACPLSVCGEGVWCVKRPLRKEDQTPFLVEYEHISYEELTCLMKFVIED